MEETATVRWDGEVFHLETPLVLEPGKRYILTILRMIPPNADGSACHSTQQPCHVTPPVVGDDLEVEQSR